MPKRTPEEQLVVHKLAEDWTASQPMYNAAANTIGNLEATKDEISNLAKGGGWLTPGATGTIRAQVANVYNTLHQILNPSDDKNLIDISKVADAQALIKNQHNQIFQLAHQMMGSHASLGSLKEAFAAVPGIENTPLGGMLVADTLEAASRWQTDQAAFKQDWANRSRGDLRNADETFRQQFKPEDYMNQVLTKYGLGPEGFTSKESVRDNYKAGLLTRDMAAKILRDKFGGQ
jgi:hypothetical protein